MNKVLFISTVWPFPEDNGKKVVISGILKYLIETYGAKNVSYIVIDRVANEIDKSCHVYTLNKPSTIVQICNVIWFALLKKTKSIQESMIYSVRINNELNQLISLIRPDLVIYDTVRISQYFERARCFGSRHILYMEDLFSVRYKKILNVMEKYPHVQIDVLGNFSRFIPKILHSIVKCKAIQKYLLTFEKEIIKKREEETVKWFDTSLLLNQEEILALQNQTGNNSVALIKPLLRKATCRNKRNYQGEPVFIFLGSLNVPHNQASIIHFIKTQMDEIIHKIPRVKLRIIGKGANKELLQLADKYVNFISIEGYVNDIEIVFRESCAMIIPLLFGSGVKLKTLESFYYGLPVISTDYGVEGINVVMGETCIVENNMDRYSDIMISLCHITKNVKISQSEMRFFDQNYSKEAIYIEYNNQFGK